MSMQKLKEQNGDGSQEQTEFHAAIGKYCRVGPGCNALYRLKSPKRGAAELIPGFSGVSGRGWHIAVPNAALGRFLTARWTQVNADGDSWPQKGPKAQELLTGRNWAGGCKLSGLKA
jgi:hypothetical protein